MTALDLRSDETKAEDARVSRAIAAERERCAKLVPRTWLDPLLSGKDAVKLPLTERGVEALLRGIQDRIRAEPGPSLAPHVGEIELANIIRDFRRGPLPPLTEGIPPPTEGERRLAIHILEKMGLTNVPR